MSSRTFPEFFPVRIYVPTIHHRVRKCLLYFHRGNVAQLLSFGCMWNMRVDEEWYTTEEECRSAIAERTGLPFSEIPTYHPERPEVQHG